MTKDPKKAANGKAAAAKKPKKAANGKAAVAKKPKKGAVAELPASITLTYSLAELPSAQHRAGLAGLVLSLRFLERTGAKGTARVESLGEHAASFVFDEAGMRELFDVVYGAATIESERNAPLKNKNKETIEPLRTEDRTVVDPKTNKEKTQKVYVYPQVQPKAAVVHDVDPTRDSKGGAWTKLWRDAIWEILRGVPAQRLPFEARAEKAACTDATEAYESLATKPNATVPLPSTFFLGAMDSSAENVPFRDRARFQFLLHFWPTVSSIFVPETEDRSGKRKFWGYAFAIPDVAFLDEFCATWPEAMKSRGVELSGYRPRESVVALSREAGLAALARLRHRLVPATSSETDHLVLAIEVVHAAKPGNSVKISEVGRIEPKASMIDEYQRVRGTLWDFTFRKQRLTNLLDEARWHRGFDRLLRTLPADRVLGRSFAHDARSQFSATESNQDEEPMGEPKELEDIILRLVTSYLSGKVAARTKLSWSDAKDDEKKRGEYDETKEKTARGAFLAIRSRTGRDFVDYFAGTLCSVPQRVTNDEFSLLSRALRETPDDVRTLTLLALSARG